MKNIVPVIAYCLFAVVFVGSVHAQIVQSVDFQNVIVCAASEADIAPPQPGSDGCETGSSWRVDPQGGHIWALFTLEMDDAKLDAIKPASLVVSAKASSHIYLNGHKIAANGKPGDNASSEIAGKMDYVVLLEPGKLKVGANQIALKLSSHQGFLDLGAPLHGVFVTPYANPQNVILRRYWPTLLPFGAFALGALYFLVMAFRSSQGLQAGLLSLMSGMTGLQLLAEVSRGLFAYAYPMHDVRLLVILFCSAAFGMALAAYTLRQFEYRPLWVWLAVFAAVSALAITLPRGLDTKASFALFGPTVLASGLALAAARKHLPFALMIGGVLATFALINLLGAGLFLDFYFYYTIAALMLFLFAQQARAYSSQQALVIEEQARADKLEFILAERRTEPEPIMISVTEVGRITQIVADDIAFISGAGDYVELTLRSGQTLLDSKTLAQLETMLPSYFLKVHRSHIVNTKVIERLERDPSGTGKLFVIGDQSVPVSRRIMPEVREALA